MGCGLSSCAFQAQSHLHAFLSTGTTPDLAGNTTPPAVPTLTNTLVPDGIYYDSLNSRRWYNNALPRLFPIATYWLSAEKSTLSTRPSGVPDVGQFE